MRWQNTRAERCWCSGRTGSLSETPSTKPQAPEEFQISKQRTRTIDAVVNDGQAGFGAWCLELVARSHSFSKIEMFRMPCRYPVRHCQDVLPPLTGGR